MKNNMPLHDANDGEVTTEYYPNGQMLAQTTTFGEFVERKSWYETGIMEGEIWMKQGVPFGRLRAWDEEGVLIVEQYYIDGVKTSKNKYSKSARENSMMPQYDEDDLVAWSELAGPTKAPPPRLTLTGYPEYTAALDWLQAASGGDTRTLGELPSVKQSEDLIHGFFLAGAVQVFVADLERDDDGSETSKHLLVQMPGEEAKRRTLLKLCNDYNGAAGYAVVDDEGQQIVSVALL